MLAVEVSNTTLPDDQGRKAALYARFGVPEYWIVNLREGTVEVRRRPRGETWGEVRIYEDGENVAPLAAQGSPIAVADLLPPATGG